jgi:hypothetical protein
MKIRIAFAVTALALTSGCVGSGHALPPASHTTSSKARLPVSFTMHWPARSSSTQMKRRPAFVSPSAQSVVIEVNPDAATPGPITFANAPAAGGTATVTIDAPAGQDVFVISLYDQAQVPSETTATGNELGRVTVAQSIAPNVTNTLSATVIGTVASVRIGPLPNQSNVVAVAGANPPSFELVGRSPATFTVAPLDVDGNVIVQPDAPPAISLTPNVRATHILSVTLVAGTTDQYTVQAIAPNTSVSPTALVATAFDANGNSATSSTIVDETSAVYVAYANGGAPEVARFAADGTPVPLGAGAFSGLQNPVALAYDADDREIFVADAGLGKVLAFDESGAPVSSFTTQTVAGANGIAYDPNDGNVYASGSGGVAVFSPSGGSPNGGIPATFVAASAQGIAFDAASAGFVLDELAIGNTATPSLAFFSEGGGGAGSATLTTAPIAIAYGSPLSVTQSPQTTAQLYITSAVGIAALTPTGGAVTTVADTGAPFGITVDPNSREPQVAERSGNGVTSYLDDLSAVDAAHSFSTPSGLGLTQPQGVCDVF